MKFSKQITLILILCIVAGGALFFFQDNDSSKNFRAYNGGTHSKRILSKSCIECLSFKRELNKEYPFSGGGRINFVQIEYIQEQHDGPMVVTNLRDDSGFYYNYKPISYYGFRNDSNQINIPVTSGFKGLKCKIRRAIDGVPEQIAYGNPNLTNEKESLEKLGITYVHMDLLRKEFATQWDMVDQEIEFFETIKPGTWVHFHCAAGKGRTTTVAVLYDIFRNGRNESLENITKHHYCLGGENLMDIKWRPDGTWTKENLEGRKALIETFYSYINAEDGYPHMKWTKWLEKHNIPAKFKLDS